jgi:hypothetical protein
MRNKKGAILMKNDTLCCDYCGEKHNYIPIIEKPSRFGFKGKIYPLARINKDNRTKDNVCLKCLEEELEAIKND